MKKIQRISSFLIMIFNFLLVALPCYTLAVWIFINTALVKYMTAHGMVLGPLQIPEGQFIDASQITNWPIVPQIIGLISDITGLLPFFLSLFALRAIFQNYRIGKVFIKDNARDYRFIGFMFFLYALLLAPLSDTLKLLAVTLTNPVGHRFLAVSFGTPNLCNILCGILVMVISWVMLEASALDTEQQLTI